MPAEPRRARLLRQLTRLREIEHRSAAIAAGNALSEAGRQRALASRAAALAQGYDAPTGATLASELASLRLSGARMRDVARATDEQAARAEAFADTRTAAERQARRRLELIEEAAERLRAEDRAKLEAKQNAALASAGPAAGGQLARFLINQDETSQGAE